MCLNCLSRSGWSAPSCVLRFACRLYPSPRNWRRTVVCATSNPCERSSEVTLATLREVHRSGDCGSPRVAPSSNASSASRSPGSRSAIGLRPAPPRLTRPSGGRSPLSTSAIPLRTVSAEIPVARTTAAIPPRPCERASAATHNRRPRSSSASHTTSQRCRIGPSSTIDPTIVTHFATHPASPPQQAPHHQTYLGATPKTRVIDLRTRGRGHPFTSESNGSARTPSDARLAAGSWDLAATQAAASANDLALQVPICQVAVLPRKISRV